MLLGQEFLGKRNFRITICIDIVINSMKIKGKLTLGRYNYNKQKAKTNPQIVVIGTWLFYGDATSIRHNLNSDTEQIRPNSQAFNKPTFLVPLKT